MEEKKEEIKQSSIIPEQKTNWSEVLTKGEEIAKRIETANIESSKILAQQQELAARNLLGGKSDAGIQPEKPIEETPREYAKRIMGGKI